MLFGKIGSDISHFSPTEKPSSSWKKLYRQGKMIWSRNFLSQFYTTEERLHTTTALLSLANSILVHMSTSQEHTHKKKRLDQAPSSGKAVFFYKNSSEKCCQLLAGLKHWAWHSQLLQISLHIVAFQFLYLNAFPQLCPRFYIQAISVPTFWLLPLH